MLAELRIVNFALIEQLTLQFQPGFTVLTGETGAGKSLLIDAIALLVGGRATADPIRSGEEEAQLEAAFHLPPAHPLLKTLRTQDVIGIDETEIILKRVLSRSGRHRVYLNGSLYPLKTLAELGGTLVDIHGQHDQQSLLASASQLDALDAFGRLHDLRGRYEQAYQSWRALQAELVSLQTAIVDRERLEDLLRFQSREIEQVGLTAGEEETLQAERQRLLHMNRLGELAHQAYGDLQGDGQALLTGLGRLARLLTELEQIDATMADCGRAVAESTVQLKEVAGRLRDYKERLEADPDRQSIVEERLDLIHQFKKKYGGSIEAVLETGRRVRDELSALETRESRTAELAAQMEAESRRVRAVAQQLSKKRSEAAKRLTKLVTAELTAVKMGEAVFDVSVSRDQTDAAFGPTGCDQVEFLLSSNPGEPPRPLGRVASGGELSRIMLALKTVLAEMDRVPVLVFDEIDTGVGGAVAAAMGTRLRKLGAFHQVFCITHLPQVASQANQHLLVEKGQDNKRTSTSVRILKGVAREEEIARMLGGLTITKKARATAAELLAGANDGRWGLGT